MQLPVPSDSVAVQSLVAPELVVKLTVPLGVLAPPVTVAE
jgi:hypothetical protein